MTFLDIYFYYDSVRESAFFTWLLLVQLVIYLTREDDCPLLGDLYQFMIFKGYDDRFEEISVEPPITNADPIELLGPLYVLFSN